MDNYNVTSGSGTCVTSQVGTPFTDYLSEAHTGYTGGPTDGTSLSFRPEEFCLAPDHDPLPIQNIFGNNLGQQLGGAKANDQAFQYLNSSEQRFHLFGMGGCGSGPQGAWPIPSTDPARWHQNFPTHITPVDPGPSTYDDTWPPYASAEDIAPPQQPIHSPTARVFTPRPFHPGVAPPTLGIVLWMKVPPELGGTKEAIASYIEKFKQELDSFRSTFHTDAKHVVCSLCFREHDSRPSNLERHLHHHLAVKTYKCRRCASEPQFTTRDQAIVHAKNHHGVARESADLVIQKLE